MCYKCSMVCVSICLFACCTQLGAVLQWQNRLRCCVGCGLWSQVGPRSHVLGGDPDAPSRVPPSPGKSWNCVCKIPRTRKKVLENEFGPEKSWKSKCKVRESHGIC